MPNLRVAGLSKRFGAVVAVEDVNLKVYEGELVVLLGPSGCGKSAVLQMIAGLQEPTEGEIWIGERMVNELPPPDRSVAIVFPNDALDGDATVQENMAVSLVLGKLEAPEIDQRLQRTAQLVGIVDELSRPASRLSKAQRFQVALARALVEQPAVLLMDDPLSILGAKARSRMRSPLIDLLHQLSMTSIYTTHNQEEAMAMGDRVLVMKAGKVEQIITPAEQV